MFDTITAKLEDVTGSELAKPEVLEIVEPQLPAIQAETHALKTAVKQNMALDYEFARANLREMISKGMTAIDGAISLTKQSESPRVYEATATFMKTLSELNSSLLDTHEKAAKVDVSQGTSAPGKQEAQTINNNNIVFSGTSDDLANLINTRLAAKPAIDV